MTNEARSGPRRQFERIHLGICPAKVTRSGGFALFGRSDIGLHLLNLSESGMKLAIKEKLEPGAKIRVVARIPAFGEIIEGDLSVTRCAPNHEGHAGFVVGASFVDLAGEQVAKIQKMRRDAHSEAGRKKIEEHAREEIKTRARTAVLVVKKK